jgi:glycosyltransferase involved in cell wall biosynthesis
MHPGEQNAILAWWWDREVAKADYVFTLTNHVADLLRQRFGTGLSPMAIVPHGPILPPRTREALGCKTDARSRALLHFGRLLPYKGLDLLADAFAELRLSHPGTTLVVAGGGDLDKANGGRLRDMPGVRIENRYLDEVEIETLMDSSDVLVLPYREASQSGVVAVAHARGLPVVVTPVGGLTEQVIDGETGVVAAGVDAASVHDAVARLLDDPALARHCALVAVERGERMWEEAAASVCRTVLLESTSEPASSHPARART